MMETTGAYKIIPHPHGEHHLHKTRSAAGKGSAPFRARNHPITVITTGPGLRFPERSPGIRTCLPTNYMYGDHSAHSVNSDMDHSPPPGAGVPPIASGQQSRAQANQLTQSQPPTRPSGAPQNIYPVPHQDVPGPHSRPDAPSVSFPPYPSPPPFGHRTTYTSPQYLLPHTHPPSHMTPSSSPFSFPHHPGTSGREASMAHLPYTPSMIPVPQHPYQRRSTDPTPSSHQTYAAGTSVTALPTYSYRPPPSSHSPMAHRQASTSPSGEEHRSPSYPSPGTYSPVGYTTPPPFIYTHPTSFVHAPSIYGPHYPPPHYAQPYSSPPLQENQGVWWYPSPGTIAGGNSFGEPRLGSRSHIDSDYPSPVPQRENEQPGQMGSVSPPHNPSPTGKYSSRSRLGSPSAIKPESLPAMARLTPSSTQTKTENPQSRDSGSDSYQKRRSYHPKSPADRSEWVMWVGNVPSDATTDELHDFFNLPPPPLSPSPSGSPMKSQRVYGGVSSVFLIARSNCAFVNFESEAQLEAATAHFHGEPLRSDDLRCPRLVCRVRRRTDDLKAGVGAQRGNGMHVKWVKEQRAKAQSGGVESSGLLEGTGRSSSPLSISDNDGEGRSPSSCSSRSGSLASTDSGVLARYFPQRYFILKSLTQYDLDLSVQRNVWATQPHNEEILDRAYRTSKDVYLLFSVNKSGEFYGYARMAGPIQQSEDRVPWASRPASPASAPLSRVSMLGEVKGNVSPSLPESTVEGHQALCNTLSPEEGLAVEQSPESTSCPPEGPSFGRVLASSAPAKLDGYDPDIPHSAKFTNTDLPHAHIPFKSFSLELDAPYRAMRDTPDQHIYEGAHPSDTVSPREHEVLERSRDAVLKTVTEEPAKLSDGPKDTSEVWGRPFCVDWICTAHLPFIRTRHLRNPWNHSREVKVSRDGTELEPSIGQQLLEEWDKPLPSPLDDPVASSRSTRRHRGSKSTHNVVHSPSRLPITQTPQ